MEAFIKAIIDKATSDITLIVALLVIGAIFAAKPLFKIYTDYSDKRDDKLNEREENLLNVIKGNSEIMSELKTLLTTSNDHCKQCKVDQIKLYEKILDKADNTSLTIHDIEVALKSIDEKFKQIL
jgi:septation ring formation regulator EzrA